MLGLQNTSWFIKLKYPEFWPMWLYYIPVWIQHFWLSIKVKNLFFFMGTNPAIDGFILSDSKYDTLKLIPDSLKPRTILIPKDAALFQVTAAMKQNRIFFPVILKPDIGFRGLGVQKIVNASSLEKAMDSIRVTYILQEFIDCPMELGIFYYRYPNQESGHIPSITIKEYLKVMGNGQDTLAELIGKNPRAILLKEKLRARFENQWDIVLDNDEILELECIGNHNRGTKFVNGNHLMDTQLLEVFDELSHLTKGLYYGRFDIKASSLEAIKKKNFKILEINGVGGEPTHIYDPETTFFTMLNDLCSIWRTAAKIASINFDSGIEQPTFREAYIRWKAFSIYKSEFLKA